MCLRHATKSMKPHQSGTLISNLRSSWACHGAQVAKSIQMTMGLHDDDVAFFLAADEPATYLQVLTPPFPPSQVMWAAMFLHCTLALRCQPAAWRDCHWSCSLRNSGRGAQSATWRPDVQQCKVLPVRRACPQGLFQQAIELCAGGPDIGGTACDLDREWHCAHWPALCKGR